MKFSNYGYSIENIMFQHASSMQRPVNGTLELLPLCNMNCDMCYIHLGRSEMEAQGSLRSADEWISLGKEMQKAGVLMLMLTGGEPLLFPEFRRLYLELRKLGMILTVNTNGTLLDEEWAAFFGQYKPRRINITLYGADDMVYETLCHFPGGFERAKKAIRLLCTQGVDVKINGSITKDNRKEIGALFAIGEEFGLPVHMDTYMLPGRKDRDLPLEDQSRLSPEDAASAEMERLKGEFAPEEFQSYVCQMLQRVEDPGATYSSGISCMAGNCSFSINWQGEMRPCVTLSEPSVPVFETGFEAAWKVISQESKKFCLSSKCIACRLRPICRTCVASAKLETGEYGNVPEYLCRYAHALLKQYQTMSVQTDRESQTRVSDRKERTAD